jgi:hypothetical protein
MELRRSGASRLASADRSLCMDRCVPAVALVIGAAAFAFRILSLRGLPNDHYMHLAWAQQLLFSDMPGRDFVDPGMTLLYAGSALMQSVWAGPFGEALLTAGMLAIAASATVVVVARVTTLRLGIAAALFQVALVPRLYSYPKILIPAVTLLVFHHFATRPGRGRLLQLSVWTGLAILLRRDLGLLAALACAIGLAALFASDFRRGATVIAAYLLAIAASLIPYLVFVALTGGLLDNVRDSVEFAKSDAHQFLAVLPAFTFFDGDGFHWSWTRTDAAVFLSYVTYICAGLSWGALYVSRPGRDREAAWTTMAVGAVFLSIFAVTILRHPVIARVPDMAAVLSIVGAWLVWALMNGARRELFTQRLALSAGITVAGAAAVVVLALTTASAWTLGGLQEKIRDTGIFGGPRNVTEHVRTLAQAGSEWPWRRFWPAGSLPTVVTYLDACTAPSDRVLVTWTAPEYYFFARRPFGAGHALFLPAGFRTTRDQDLMMERLAKHRVPIVLVNEDSRGQFAAAYPLLDEYLQWAYAPGGRFVHYDGSRITIAVHRSLRAARAFGPEGWPCGFDDPESDDSSPSAVPLPRRTALR